MLVSVRNRDGSFLRTLKNGPLIEKRNIFSKVFTFRKEDIMKNQGMTFPILYSLGTGHIYLKE